MAINIYNENHALFAQFPGAQAANLHVTLDGECTLSLTVPAKKLQSAKPGWMMELGTLLFDVVRVDKSTGLTNSIYKLSGEHVSYRLSDITQAAAVFSGTAAAVLAQLLSGTDFTVGTVSITGTYTLTITEDTTKRDALQQWVAKVGGELSYSGYAINIVSHVGSSTRQALSDKKNVQAISVTLDSRSDTQTYGVTLYRETVLKLGDEVSIVYPALGLNINSRIIAMDYDPFQQMAYNLTCGEYVPSWTTSVISSLQEKVGVGKSYYGNTISRTNGFKSELDSGAYALFNADGLEFVDEDGLKCLYYDSTAGTFVINGTLGSEAVFTDSLYAEQGDVAELTVDRVSTSRRIRMYLLHDTSDDLFVRVQDRYVQWVAATPSAGSSSDNGQLLTEAGDTLTTEGGDIIIAENSVSAVQASNRYGDLLWWQKDISNATISSEGYPFVNGEQVFTTTQNTGYPVMVYSYDELVKLQIAFESDGTDYTPIVTLGAGDETGHSKAVISKTRTGVAFLYDRSGGSGNIGFEMNNSGQIVKTVGSNSDWQLMGYRVYANLTVAVSDWTSDSTYSSYPYRADVTCADVTADMLADVIFDPDDASGGNLSSYAVCGAGIVSVYAVAVPAADVSIKRIGVRR